MNFIDNIASVFGYSKRISGIQTVIFTGNGNTPAFEIDLTSFYGLKDAYEKCSPISTIIGKLATAMSNGKWWIVDENDNDLRKAEKKTSALLERPNPLQSWTELMIQAETFRYLYGEVFFYFSIPEGFGAKDASGVWVINPEYTDIDYYGKMYDQRNVENIVKRYILRINNDHREIKPNEILHVKDIYQNINFNPNDLRGKSRLISLKYEIKNIIQAQEAIYSLNKDRGAQGILINRNRDESGNVPLTKSRKDDLQKQFNEYGLSEKQKKVIISDTDVDWKQISYNVRDLMLFEGMKANTENIADAFNYPFELLANSKGATFSNKSEAEKIMYQDSVIPFSKIYAEKFTSFFGLKNSKIIIDFGEVECMKESRKEEAGALQSLNSANETAYRNGVITVNEWRRSIEMDEITGGDVYNERKKEG
ncbi:MAG: phage portal protein [Candidatus Azobacteroides sp.]|nr:phage portal protein [Candidatus Azobacteroides sp.]